MPPAVRRLAPLVEPGPGLTAAQRTRYARHLALPFVGDEGQRRLLAAKVAVVGAGGLGSPVLLYLAAAGVGTLGVIDDDRVETSNLQRQIIHTQADVGRAKTASVARAVTALNSDVRVEEHTVRLDADNVDDVLGAYDLVIDGSDNFPTRYLVNDACERLDMPFVWASLLQASAQVTTFWRSPNDGLLGPDLRDLFPAPPDPWDVPTCGDAGVLGALCAQVGGIMATEAISMITGTGGSLLGRVLVIDSLMGRTDEIALVPQGRRDERHGGAAEHQRTVRAPEVRRISAVELARRLREPDSPVVLDVREPAEVAMAAIDGSVRVPLGRLTTSDLVAIPHNREIVVHCKSGPRAERAAEVLTQSGLSDVTVLEGGIDAWLDAVACP